MPRGKPKPVDLSCVECGFGFERAVLVPGTVIYRHRPDLADLQIWRCPCGAYVGCHKGTTSPKGRPAGPLTHRARIDAHAAFDPLWRAKSLNEGLALSYCRAKAYKWLGEAMGLPPEQVHIGHFTRAQAEQVVQIVRAARAAKREEKNHG